LFDEGEELDRVVGLRGPLPVVEDLPDPAADRGRDVLDRARRRMTGRSLSMSR